MVFGGDVAMSRFTGQTTVREDGLEEGHPLSNVETALKVAAGMSGDEGQEHFLAPVHTYSRFPLQWMLI